jgi:colicin import membrane protein
VSAIQARIRRAWNEPPSHPEIQCVLYVTQDTGGQVSNVRIGSPCNADAAVRQTILNAAYAASPLPQAPDPSVFDRNLNITFNAPAK